MRAYPTIIEFRFGVTDFHGETISDIVDDLLSSFKMNGLIANHDILYQETNGEIVVFAYSSSSSLFTEKNYNKYILDRLENLRDKILYFEIKEIGDVAPINLGELIDFYIVNVPYQFVCSPLFAINGESYYEVPLNSIPHTFDHSYYDIVTLESRTRALLSLYFDSLLEKFVSEQLINPDSEFMRSAINVCKNIELVTKKKTYFGVKEYVIMDYYDYNISDYLNINQFKFVNNPPILYISEMKKLIIVSD